MSDRSWEPDPKLTRPAHKWVFVRVERYDWGIQTIWRCENSGCPTTRSLPVNPNERDPAPGICFDTHRAKRIT